MIGDQQITLKFSVILVQLRFLIEKLFYSVTWNLIAELMFKLKFYLNSKLLQYVTFSNFFYAK
jgi:hypothetical protein